MKDNELPQDSEWNNVFLKRPDNGQLCTSKAAGKAGYVGECIYQDGYFETYKDSGNRFQITRWKHDLWLPVNPRVDE